MSAVLSPSAGLQQKRGLLLGTKGWAGVIAALAVICVVFPVLNLLVPEGSVFHVSDYMVQLTGKILVLVFIILFIQKRPRGLFALKGRAAEA